MTHHTPAMSEAEYRENKFFEIFGSVPEPAFESEAEQVDGWGRRWGCTNDVGKLRAVLMHRPGDEQLRVGQLAARLVGDEGRAVDPGGPERVDVLGQVEQRQPQLALHPPGRGGVAAGCVGHALSPRGRRAAPARSRTARPVSRTRGGRR